MVLAETDLFLRSRQESDEAFFEDLFRVCNSAEFLPLPLPPQAVAQLLTIQYRGRNMTYATRYPRAEDSAIVLGEQAVGRLVVDRTGLQYHIIDIAIAPAFRGRGIATTILERVLTDAASAGAGVRLHMRPGNLAARLYERLGFTATGGDGMHVEMCWSPWAAQEHASTPPTREPVVAQEMSSAYFRTLEGHTLQARAGHVTSALVLDTVQTLRIAANAQTAGDSFVLRFSGPAETALPTATVEITPPGSSSMEIFLTPTAAFDGRVQYEAVFNRSQAGSASQLPAAEGVF